MPKILGNNRLFMPKILGNNCQVLPKILGSCASELSVRHMRSVLREIQFDYTEKTLFVPCTVVEKCCNFLRCDL